MLYYAYACMIIFRVIAPGQHTAFYEEIALPTNTVPALTSSRIEIQTLSSN